MLHHRSQKGFAAFYLTIVVLAVMTLTGASLYLLSQNRSVFSRNILKSSQALMVAEAGLEDAVYRIKKNKQYSANYNLTLGGGTTSINISGANIKIITSRSNLNNIFRNLQAVLNITTINPQFFYGVQVGEGGVSLGQNSQIKGVGGAAGNFYSNGAVNGASGATVTGDVTVATGESALDGVVVYGTARANAITNSKVCGDAYYKTIDSSSSTFLNNPKKPPCPDPLTPGAGNLVNSDPPVSNRPISQANINQWKTEAQTGGTIAGDYNVTTDVSLGPKEITGNLNMTSNNKILTVAGIIYVRGNINIDNGSTARCSSSFGENSCLILADGWIHIKNNSQFIGSGQSGSYIMLLTTLPGCNGGDQTSPCTHHNGAIDLHNNANGAIFYAVSSLTHLHQGVNVSAINAYKLELENNAVVAYEQGLVSVQFSSGPGASYKINSWQEIE